MQPLAQMADLDYIESAAIEALERQAEAPILQKSQIAYAERASSTIVAGLEINDHAEVESRLTEAKQARLRSVKSYYGHRKALQAKLEALGITPRVILPAAAWKRICETVGLYVLEPNDRGEIRVEGEKILSRYSLGAIILSVLSWTALLFVIGAVTGYAAYVMAGGGAVGMESAVGWGFWSFVLTGVVGYFFIMGLVLGGRPFTALYRILLKPLLKIYDWTPREWVLHDFLPNRCSPGYSPFIATIALPMPPQDVAAVLAKAKKLALQVATVGEAIVFVNRPSQTLMREALVRIEAFNEKIRSTLADPIVFCYEDSAVAIIAQFGDFPIEKQVIDQALFSEHLI